MKGVLSVFTFGIGALCFVIFITVLKPNAISAVSGPSKPEYCNSEAAPTHQNPLPLPLPAFARARRVEYSLARAFISDTDFEQMLMRLGCMGRSGCARFEKSRRLGRADGLGNVGSADVAGGTRTGPRLAEDAPRCNTPGVWRLDRADHAESRSNGARFGKMCSGPPKILARSNN